VSGCIVNPPVQRSNAAVRTEPLPEPLHLAGQQTPGCALPRKMNVRVAKPSPPHRVARCTRTPARTRLPPPPRAAGKLSQSLEVSEDEWGRTAGAWDAAGLYVGGLPFEADASDVRAWIDQVCR